MALPGRIGALVVAVLAMTPHGRVLQSSQFIFDTSHSEDKKSGLIQLASNTKLRFNVKGGQPKEGDPVVLWECSPGNHEIFTLGNGDIKMGAYADRCLNVEGGANAGHRIITWPCSHNGKQTEHEQFSLGKDGRIKLKKKHSLEKKHMCINVKGGIEDGGSPALGAELILWPCADTPQPNEVFVFDEGQIKLKSNQDFHFNVAGGNVEGVHDEGTKEKGGFLVMWTCNAGSHEVFEFRETGQIRLKNHPDHCLNSAGGLVPGNPIVSWPCSNTLNTNELFAYDKKRKVIHSIEAPSLGFNVAGANLAVGGDIVLWSLDDGEL